MALLGSISASLPSDILEKYKILKHMGRGTFGDVVKCRKTETNQMVALKLLRNNDSSLIKEVDTLEKLRYLDPDKCNFVRFHEFLSTATHGLIVFELLEKTLLEYMQQRKWAPMPLHGLKTVIRDITTALSALKGVGLIHTDLKLDNVMLVDHRRKPFRVKLIDFGLTLATSEVRQGYIVQPRIYRSPEIILGLKFTEAIDIWSLGMMMATLLVGFALFSGNGNYDMLRFITDLLGNIPTALLDHGLYTRNYYDKTGIFCLKRWSFKSQMDIYCETGKMPRGQKRKCCFNNLDELKTFRQLRGSRAEDEDVSACVDLLKKMLQKDPTLRITPSEVLADPFVVESSSASSFGRNEHAETHSTLSDADASDSDSSPLTLTTKF